MIRVGRCIYDTKGAVSYPEIEGFKKIVVMMRSHSTYSSLSPYELQNDQGHIMENIFQYSKVYEKVPKSVQKYSRWNPQVIWDHPAETHLTLDPTNPKDLTKAKLTPQYLAWRKKGMATSHAIRYPTGYTYRHKCLFALTDENVENHTQDPDANPLIPLSYIEGRKQIYVPTYTTLAKKERKFAELKALLDKGTNLLIIEVDGPHQESLPYYKTNYGVADDFIVNNTMIANEANLDIMLNDPKHPFGHGYCLAMALLNAENDESTPAPEE